MSDSPVEPAHDILDDVLLSILLKQEAQPLAHDVASLALRCAACDRAFDAGFRFDHSPYTGQVGAPLYRTLDDALAACASLLDRRDGSIDEGDWAAARRCSCGAPAHLTRTERARIVRTLAGAASAVVIEARRAGEVTTCACLRVPHRGLPERVAPTSSAFREAFGRPLTLFDAWSSLDPDGPAHVEAEAGVTLWVAPDAHSLRGEVEAALQATPLVVVMLEPRTVATGVWPQTLAALGSHVEAGRAAALVIERRVMHARLRALAAPHGALVDHPRPERFELRYGPFVGLAYAHRIARAMASHGLTLGDACAHAIDETVSGLRRIEELLAHATSARPGSRVTIEGGLGAILRADGSLGPPFALESLPVHLEASSPEMEREIRYLCDSVPAWSDPTRMCACGAPASVQRRLMPFHAIEAMSGSPEREPWTLETWSNGGEERAADVIVVACDKHRRIHPRRWLEAAGLDERSLRERLVRDRDLASFAIELEVVEDEPGARAIIARGPLSASLLLDPAWLAGLHAYAGRPIESAVGEAWAFAPDGVCLLDVRFREAERADLALRTALASGLPPEAPRPFAIRVRADLGVIPAGRFAPLPAAPGVV